MMSRTRCGSFSAASDGTAEIAVLLWENLRTLGFQGTMLSHTVPQRKDIPVLRAVIHFLFSKLDEEEARKRFETCWPISDGRSERYFRETVTAWLTELREQKDAAPFMAAFHPRMLLHLEKCASVEFLATFSVLVLQRCVQRMGDVDLIFNKGSGMENPVMLALIDVVTERHLASVDALRDSLKRMEEEVATFTACLAAQEEEAELKLKILRERSPVKIGIDKERVEQDSIKVAALAAEVQSVLEAWTELCGKIQHGALKYKAESAPGGELDFAGVLCRLTGKLQDASSMLQDADFSAVEDTIPFLQAQLNAKKDTLAKLQLTRQKLERMVNCFTEAIAKEEEELSKRPAMPLRDIVIDGVVFNLGDFLADEDAAECQETKGDTREEIETLHQSRVAKDADV